MRFGITVTAALSIALLFATGASFAQTTIAQDAIDNAPNHAPSTGGNSHASGIPPRTPGPSPEEPEDRDPFAPPAPAGGSRNGSSDDFNRTDGTDMGSSWTEISGDIGIQTNQGIGISTGASTMQHNTASLPYADSVSSVEFYNTTGSIVYLALIAGWGTDGVFVKVQDNNSDGMFDRVYFYKVSGGGWGANPYSFDLATPTSSGIARLYFTGSGDIANFDIDNNFDGISDEHFEASGVTGISGLGTGFGIGTYKAATFDNWNVSMAPVTIPFYEGFESGTLRDEWQTVVTGAGRIQVTGDNTPVGAYHVTMDSTTNGVYSTITMTIPVDLSGVSDCYLDFLYKEFGDETHTEDGIFISADGATYHKALDLSGLKTYTSRRVDLAQAAADAGISFTSNFRVRFSWRDNYSIPTDGFAFDEIRITVPPAPGKLTTLFGSNNGYAGNTFDIVPMRRMQIRGLDVNVSNAGVETAIDVYYKTATSVGYESNSAAWTLLASGTGTSAGNNLPTYIDLPEAALVTLDAGQTYGIYVHCASYPAVSFRYTNGDPATYSNYDLLLTTNSGQASPAFGSKFSNRMWNGTLYYAPIVLVPSEYTSVQAGMDGCWPGDTVLVSPGVYSGNIDFKGKALTLKSSGGAKATTTLQGTGSGSVVTFNADEGPDSVIDGFTITGGGGVSYGGGIYCRYASPTIVNNVVTGNAATSGGGGMYVYRSNATIENNTISNNTATYYGGAVYCYYSSATFDNNTVTGNTVTSYYGGAFYITGSTAPASFTNNVICGNHAGQNGGGIKCYSPLTVLNCTVCDNSAGTYGGGIVLYNSSYLMPITNTIVWGNSAPTYPQVRDYHGNGGIAATYCDIEEGSVGPEPWYGTGCIDADPGFTSPGSNDYHITGGPCIDAGNNSAPSLPERDFEGEERKWDGDLNSTVIVDIGADEYNNPNLIELVYFAAFGYKKRALVIWETASEIDTAGFHVWRSRKPDADFVRITPQLIPARGSVMQGARYYILDTVGQPGHTYYYQLEDIDYSWESTFHKPVELRPWRPTEDVR